MAGYTGIKDRTGQKLGRLTFMWPSGMKGKHVHWRCLCECGNFIDAAGIYIQEGNIRSCGCLRKDSIQRIFRKHGKTGTLEYTMWKSAHQRAKRDNLPFTISVEDIVIPNKCPLLGIPLYPGTSKEKDNSPSLDKIIPKLGYVKNNIQVISHRANFIKSNATLTELETIIRNWKAQCG